MKASETPSPKAPEIIHFEAAALPIIQVLLQAQFLEPLLLPPSLPAGPNDNFEAEGVSNPSGGCQDYIFKNYERYAASKLTFRDMKVRWRVQRS